MKAPEFCYWLQGLFELHNPEVLDDDKVVLIKKHLLMVFLHEKVQSEHLDFCKSLRGYFQLSGRKNVDENVTKNIKEQLDSLFVHVVNPKNQRSSSTPPRSYPRMGMSLDPSGDNNTLIKC